MRRYSRGTVSRLWLNTSGAASITISAAPGLRRKSGVSTSIVVFAASVTAVFASPSVRFWSVLEIVPASVTPEGAVTVSPPVKVKLSVF